MGLIDIDPPSINYPAALTPYLGRKIWKSTMGEVEAKAESWPLFVKPAQDKRFTSVVVESVKDLIPCGPNDERAKVICSEAVDFRAEWRCFVRYGEILDVRPYKEDWRHDGSLDSRGKLRRGRPIRTSIVLGVP